MYITPINLTKGTLYLSSAPGRNSFMFGSRKLNFKNEVLRDLEIVEKVKPNLIVVLLSRDELSDFPIDLLNSYRQMGILVKHYPIPDYQVPSNLSSFANLIDQIVHSLRADRKVLIHCAAGMGRTGLVASSVLIKLGLDWQRALMFIRKRRPGSVETKLQVEFLKKYEEW